MTPPPHHKNLRPLKAPRRGGQESRGAKTQRPSRGSTTDRLGEPPKASASRLDVGARMSAASAAWHGAPKVTQVSQGIEIHDDH